MTVSLCARILDVMIPRYLELFISYLSKILRIDVRFYARSSFWMSLGQASTIARGVATTLLMARWLPKESLGQFRYILALFGLAGIFSLTGLNTGIIRGVSQGDTVVVRAAIKRLLIATPLGGLLLVLIAMERLFHGDTTVAYALILTGVLYPAYTLCGLYGPILTGQERVLGLVKRSIAANIVFSFIFFFSLLYTHNILALLAIYFGVDIALRGAFTLKELYALPSKGTVKDHLSLGGHMSAIGVFQAIASQLDQLLIQHFGGYGSLANYGIATVIPEQIKDFATGLNGIVLRRFSRRAASQETLTSTRHHFWVTLLISAAGIIAYALLAPFLIPFLFPKYATEVWPSVVYSIGLLSLCTLIGTSYFQAHHQVKRLWTLYTTNGVLQIITNLLLIPLFGSWGAIFSRTATRVLSIPLAYPKEIDSPKPKTQGSDR